MLFQLFRKKIKGLIVEIKSRYGGHGLSLMPFDFTTDANRAVGFVLKSRFGSLLFASAGRNRTLNN